MLAMALKWAPCEWQARKSRELHGKEREKYIIQGTRNKLKEPQRSPPFLEEEFSIPVHRLRTKPIYIKYVIRHCCT